MLKSAPEGKHLSATLEHFRGFLNLKSAEFSLRVSTSFIFMTKYIAIVSQMLHLDVPKYLGDSV
jgi:hypothetical protein